MGPNYSTLKRTHLVNCDVEPVLLELRELAPEVLRHRHLLPEVVVEEHREKNDMSLQARNVLGPERCRMRRAGSCLAEESILLLGR